jgi:hypothetical protein
LVHCARILLPTLASKLNADVDGSGAVGGGRTLKLKPSLFCYNRLGEPTVMTPLSNDRKKVVEFGVSATERCLSDLMIVLGATALKCRTMQELLVMSTSTSTSVEAPTPLPAESNDRESGKCSMSVLQQLVTLLPYRYFIDDRYYLLYSFVHPR